MRKKRMERLPGWRSRPGQVALPLVLVAAVGHDLHERPVRAEFHDADRADRTAEAVAEATHVDAEQAAQRDADGRLVRDDQDVAVLVPPLDLVDDLQGTVGDGDGRLAARWRIPR